MKRLKKYFCGFFALIIVSGCIFRFPIIANAAQEPSIITTLVDNQVQRGSKKTFDVSARDPAGQKIKATVRFNGEPLDPIWDDSEKSSYTLNFTKEGQNQVIVSAISDEGRKKEITYNITYIKADPGDFIGNAIWSVELFTIGCGYLVYPEEMPIYEGETAADQLIRLLHKNGYAGYYNGTTKSGFYLGYISDGDSTAETYDGYRKSGSPEDPVKLNIKPSIPSMLIPYLNKTMTFFDTDDYEKNREGNIGEFVFTNGSGWMYCINNIFPNVSFSDSYLSDGDVVRVQYSLAYGADIGGSGVMGGKVPYTGNSSATGFYSVANKDILTRTISKALRLESTFFPEFRSLYDNAVKTAAELNATQDTVDNAAAALNNALNCENDIAVAEGSDHQTGSANGSEDSSAVISDPVEPYKDTAVSDGSADIGADNSFKEHKTETVTDIAVTSLSVSVSSVLSTGNSETSKIKTVPETNIITETETVSETTEKPTKDNADNDISRLNPAVIVAIFVATAVIVTIIIFVIIKKRNKNIKG